jgi:hypothetical protein
MTELKRIFLVRSLGELEALSTAINRADDQTGERCVELACPILHRIHGTGASLGMRELGELARLLRASLNSVPVSKALLLQGIRALVQYLREMPNDA